MKNLFKPVFNKSLDDDLVVPLIVGDCSWSSSIPDWLRQKAVANARERLASLNQSSGVSDEEALCYLMTSSLRAPLKSTYADIYVHLTVRVLAANSMPIPSGMGSADLSSDALRELCDLRSEISGIQLNIYKDRNSPYRRKLAALSLANVRT